MIWPGCERGSGGGRRTGEPFSIAYRASSGRQPAHVVARGRALLTAREPVRVVGTNRDVTVEREAELRLRASEEQFVR